MVLPVGRNFVVLGLLSLIVRGTRSALPLRSALPERRSSIPIPIPMPTPMRMETKHAANPPANSCLEPKSAIYRATLAPGFMNSY